MTSLRTSSQPQVGPGPQVHHLDSADALDFALGQLAEPARASLELHLADCASCQGLVAEALRSSTADTPGASATKAARPTQLGRFNVLGPLGSGAMGLVFEAYDPQLERVVALKLCQSSRREADRERVLGEARSMARLAHPHVVAVHEVGFADDELFLVMERIEGTTLLEYATTHRSEPHLVLDAYRQAGRGLLAAHRAGVIHRDFKPENVLVDRTGHARVTDFGLAISADDGALAGTPVYLAPEVLRGERATEASDQFSFCVALYEALAGRRPWQGSNEVAREVPAPELLQARVPKHVRRALERGLSLAPAARFESMAQLLEALSPPTRRAPAAGWAMLGALAVGALWLLFSPSPAAALQCGSTSATHCERLGSGELVCWGEGAPSLCRRANGALECRALGR